MAAQSLDSFLAAIGGIAAGSLQGQEQARQEHVAQTAQQQNQLIQLIPHLQAQAEQQRQAQLAPYNVLAPHLGQMTPEAQADFLTKYSAAAGQQPAGPNYSQIAGSFDPNSPAGALLRGTGGPAQAPAPQVYYGTPPVSRTPAPNGAPAPNMAPNGPVPAPNGLPLGGPVAVANAGGPATPAAAPGENVVRTPFGSFALGGVTKEQRTRQAGSFEKASAPYRRAGLAGEPALAFQRLVAGYNPEPKTAAELQANDQVISQLNANAAVLLSPAQVGAQMKTETGSYQQGYTDLLTGKKSDLAAAVALRGLRQEEKGLGERYGKQTSVPLDNLAPYDEEISQIDKLLSPTDDTGAPKSRDQLLADRQSAGSLAKDVTQALKNPVAPADEAKEFNSASKILSNLSPEQQRNPELAANAVQDVAPHLAQRIRENGLQFGGAGAERRFTQLMGQFKEFSQPGTPAAARQAYVDSLIAAAKLTGRKIELTADDVLRVDPMAALKLKQAGLTIQKTQGEIKVQPLEAKEREARLGLIVAQTSEAQARTAKIKAGAAAGAGQKGLLTQNAQLRVDTAAEQTALKAYTETLKANYLDTDPKFDVTKPRPGKAEDAVARKAYETYVQARARTQATLRTMGVNVADPQWNPVAGSAGAETPAAPAGTPASPRGPTGRVVNPGTGQEFPKPAGARGLRTITTGGRTFQINPATFDAQARARGMTPQQIQRLHAQYGF